MDAPLGSVHEDGAFVGPGSRDGGRGCDGDVAACCEAPVGVVMLDDAGVVDPGTVAVAWLGVWVVLVVKM